MYHLEQLVYKVGAGITTLVMAVECEKVIRLYDIVMTLVHIRGGRVLVMILVVMMQSKDCCTITATPMLLQPAYPWLPVWQWERCPSVALGMVPIS